VRFKKLVGFGHGASRCAGRGCTFYVIRSTFKKHVIAINGQWGEEAIALKNASLRGVSDEAIPNCTGRRGWSTTCIAALSIGDFFAIARNDGFLVAVAVGSSRNTN